MEDKTPKMDSTVNYVQEIKKQKFSVFWSKVESNLIRQFLESESIEKK